MRGIKICIGILFVLWIATIIGGYNIYLLQREKIERLRDENNSLLQKVSLQKREITKLGEKIEGLSRRMRIDMERLESKVTSNTLRYEAISSLVQKMKRNIEEWQRNYHSILREIRQYLEDWRKDVTSQISQDASQKVELGEIAVEK